MHMAMLMFKSACLVNLLSLSVVTCCGESSKVICKVKIFKLREECPLYALESVDRCPALIQSMTSRKGIGEMINPCRTQDYTDNNYDRYLL